MGCTTEQWTIENLANALMDMHKDNKRIAVPMFQRGQRWNNDQRVTFIDSLLKGYPVGDMLFYETFEDGVQTYILVDGLQRGNSIKKYMQNPTDFFDDQNISEEFCEKIEAIVGVKDESKYALIRKILTDFITSEKTFKNLQYYRPAKDIADAFKADETCISDLITVIGDFFSDRQNKYDQIAQTQIPVEVYRGDAENLTEIFTRINSKGTPLDQYEVYAAAWPVNQRFRISNTQVVEYAIKKYDAFISDGYIIQGYDREDMRKTKKLNAFEYLFGLSKYLVDTYDILAFDIGKPDDTVNPLGFELVNACLNDTDRIKTLYKNIYQIKSIDAFENALYQAISFVESAVQPITTFKGNTRGKKKKPLHSKYLIMSMISTTFKEMYPTGDYSKVVESWDDIKANLAKNLRLYYVYDIINDYWSEGGTGKIHAAAKPNRYMNEISPRSWKTALDGFFEKSMGRSESRKVEKPKAEEYVLLNCIYLGTFTAMDQLSLDRFDVEHIAPKNQMTQFILATGGRGLPISCIANLCYLPEYVNRSKKNRNFYQDTKYLKHVNLDEVERKYSFTVSEDLEWMDMEYAHSEDYDELKSWYTDFLTNRFEKMKKKFCESMGIDYESMSKAASVKVSKGIKEGSNKEASSESSSRSAENEFIEECIRKIEKATKETLTRVNRTVYTSADGKKGYVMCSSKPYRQGKRDKYWFAYRKQRLEHIKKCKEKFVVYGCKNSKDVLILPVSVIEDLLPALNTSIDEDGKSILHWHVVLLRDDKGSFKLLKSHPSIEEIDMDRYKI